MNFDEIVAGLKAHGPLVVAVILWAETRALPILKRAAGWARAAAEKAGATEADEKKAEAAEPDVIARLMKPSADGAP